MHVIDGQAGLIFCASLIFYSLTIDNILNIIVLLILVGISISMLSGDNGILQKATDAKTETEKGQEKEIVELAYNSALAKKVSNNDSTPVTDEDLNIELSNQGVEAKGNSPITVTFDISKRQYTIDNGVINFAGIKSDSDIEEDTPQEITASTPAGKTVITPNDWTTLNGKAISDGNGTAIPLPTGFYYVGGDYNTGLVISDKENDTIDASGISMGNQFVWIPVPDETALTLTGSYGQEPYPYGYSTETAEFNRMKTQVLLYGGFYIGRYEAGVDTTTLRTEATNAQTVVCKKGVAPYNYVKWGDSARSIGTSGAVYLAQNMYSISNSVISTLCYGRQWDAMCRYIGTNEANKTTPTKSAVELTGSVSTDVSKNIYDIAGNCREWTMEGHYEEDYDEDSRYHCGGYFFSSTYKVSSKSYDVPDDYDESYSFRPTLYIK